MTADRTTRWLEVAVSVSAPLVIATSGAISYTSLYDLARGPGGFGEVEAHLFPFPIDFNLGGNVAASFLLARWQARLWPRLWVGLQVVISGVATISGNALHGWMASHSHPWVGLGLAVSAVPGAAIVGMTHTVSIMLRCRPRADEDQAPEPTPGKETRALEEREQAQERRQRRPASSSASPKESRVRALLEEGRIAVLRTKEERAALIARVAEQVEASRSYVRKIAGRLEQESGSLEPEEHAGAVAMAGER